MIDVIGLRKSHGDLEVLRGIDLTVDRGEVAVIIGPSGGGKSTLLRCLIGLERFEGGSIVIDGTRLDGDSTERERREALARIRRKVGMVFQGFHLFPHRSVLENVTEAPIYVLGQRKDEAEARALALLDRVGMASFADRRPATLSGGQQQRVAIARALAMGPEAILFDEPTSALDPLATGEVLAVMADLAREGQSMVVVTHAMEFARRAAHSVHVFADGLVVESGPPERIFEDPREDVTRNFLCKTRAA